MVKPTHSSAVSPVSPPAGALGLLPDANLGETLPQSARQLVPARTGEPERAYVVIFEEHSALTYALPTEGKVIIGRAPEVALQLGDPSASRQHARLDVHGGEVWLSDLGSRNGTQLNGEPVSAARPLSTGDVITICNTSLVFCRQLHASSQASLYTFMQLRQRLQEEIDRALRYHRPLSLLCLQFSQPPAQAAALGSIAEHLRKMDGVAWSNASQLLILTPELDGDEAASLSGHMLSALGAAELKCRAGFAVCPADGSDVETLLGGAQAAAAAATHRGLALKAAETATTISIGPRQIVLVDPAMVRVYNLIEKLAKSDLPVLIQGETGVGKEIAASAIHHLSRRSGRPFISVNCAALPESLVESELFGHERGAFSGAVAAKPGLLEAANTGTIFLDEIGELPLAVQAKLLRVLETQRIMRVGEVRERAIDVRIVAATNRDLQDEIASSRFRKDLFFRLGAARLTLPPLRDRRRELPVLARALLAEACTRVGREPITISAAAMYRLQLYGWPGNVRELRNIMDFIAATLDGDVLLPWHLDEQLATAGQPADGGAVTATAAALPPTKTQFRPIDEEVRELEKRRMAEALAATKGVQSRAAELISMPIRTFTAKLKQYQLGSRKPAE